MTHLNRQPLGPIRSIEDEPVHYEKSVLFDKCFALMAGLDESCRANNWPTKLHGDFGSTIHCESNV